MRREGGREEGREFEVDSVYTVCLRSPTFTLIIYISVPVQRGKSASVLGCLCVIMFSCF